MPVQTFIARVRTDRSSLVSVLLFCRFGCLFDGCGLILFLFGGAGFGLLLRCLFLCCFR